MTCKRCAELEAQNAALISKLANIERMVVPKANQLIQFDIPKHEISSLSKIVNGVITLKPDDSVMPWDTAKAKPTRAESMRIGDESIDNIKLPKPGDDEIPF